METVVCDLDQFGHDDIQASLKEMSLRYCNIDEKTSTEEKKKDMALVRNVMDVIKKMVNEHSSSLESETGMDASDDNKSVLKMSGNFFVDASGTIQPPEKEILTTALNSVSIRRWDKEDTVIVSVESIVVEENFHHIVDGPNSPNYLMKEQEVYVRLQGAEQAAFVLGVCSRGNDVTHG
jgi:hypothetical protein